VWHEFLNGDFKDTCFMATNLCANSEKWIAESSWN